MTAKHDWKKKIKTMQKALDTDWGFKIYCFDCDKYISYPDEMPFAQQESRWEWDLKQFYPKHEGHDTTHNENDVQITQRILKLLKG